MPSAAPTPRPAYITQAKKPPVRMAVPQPLLLVTDLNGTLIYRKFRLNFRHRPGLENFLKEIFSYHQVMVWTSARPENAQPICTRLMTPDQKKKCVAIWARNTLGLTRDQYASHIQVYKNLDKIWDNPSIQKLHPNHKLGERWGQHNTVLIDDSVIKASANPYNLVHIPELTRDLLAMEIDGHGALKEVAGYLDEARHYADVSAFIYETPFSIERGWGRRVDGRFGDSTSAPDMNVQPDAKMPHLRGNGKND